MLEIQNLTAGYGELEVLQEVSLHIGPAEIVALIGPNGAGKSTVIKSVFGLTHIARGMITFKEKKITKMKTSDLVGLGISYVPQGKINFPSLSVLENLEIGAPAGQDKALLTKNLSFVFHKFPALREKREKPAYTLSGGQQQMLALGRALMREPALLLLDEPSLGLSPKLQKEAFTMINSLRADGIAIIIVEQNAKKAIEIADRTYLLEEGKVVLEGGREMITHKKIKSVYLGGRY
ncbi:ABC transporter ATP-binding protein [Candidatus Woesearchaeota archaeon]|nr:MAG: branched-chain amino acid transport system ATP-binding protein [archaeon GW2011_AR4]MBS3129309.1 ABC transporter ATP-binding protein [Candidatus Woesearchaeota archaeon]HIH38612.1 ABC transporter ATP-binding protein [Candidatus Woesearchaeota archaeon]HIH49449.1 ABC transporter ATP-binding protein [Candidatus Woesearchaeota archaeon]HIJ02816.1 ABC transporter ATP-binding protein [Candidatus Woesearchaeota archaeon]